MNLKTLSNDNLITCFENVVRSERKITAQVLDCIAEIDRRKLFVQKDFKSLFDYLVKGLGYSPGAAMRRIDAARLLRELPEVAEKFQDGSLTLSQANQLERASREYKKIKNEKLTTENKRELVLQIENSTQKQTEQIIAVGLDLPIVPVQKETLHRDQSVTLTITFTQEQMEILQQAQNMISHSVVSKDWAEALTYLAKREVKRRTGVREPKVAVVAVVKAETCKTTSQIPSVAALQSGSLTKVAPDLNVVEVKKGNVTKFELLDTDTKTNDNALFNVVASVKTNGSSEVEPDTSVTGIHTEALFTSAAEVKSGGICRTVIKRRALPAAVRKTLLHGNAVCAYKHANGKICESQRFLQIDHIHSWSRGGANDPENLQVLCGVHNRLKFEMESIGDEHAKEEV